MMVDELLAKYVRAMGGQTGAAAALVVRRQTIYNWQSMPWRVPFRHLRTMARHLGVSMDGVEPVLECKRPAT